MTARQQLISQVCAISEVLANPLRMKLFLQILQEGCDCSFAESDSALESTCVKGLMVSLDMPQSTVSTYLKELERAGLIECQKVGRNLYCRPAKEGLTSLKLFTESALKQIRYKV